MFVRAFLFRDCATAYFGQAILQYVNGGIGNDSEIWKNSICCRLAKSGEVELSRNVLMHLGTPSIYQGMLGSAPIYHGFSGSAPTVGDMYSIHIFIATYIYIYVHIFLYTYIYAYIYIYIKMDVFGYSICEIHTTKPSKLGTWLSRVK